MPDQIVFRLYVGRQLNPGLFIPKVIVALLFFFCLACRGDAQAYFIGHRQFTFIDAERNDRSVQTEIYYPSSIAGDNVPVAGENGMVYPILVFGHGFVMEWSAYANFWKVLVPNGYIIAFPRTETGISPNHLTFGRDLAFVIKTLQDEGKNAASPFFGRIDTTSCVMGHSMGGGASFLAVQFNDDITAIVNFAAAETNPSAITACSAIDIPALVFAGDNDCITPLETNQVLMYDSLRSVCKTLVRITGASHCQFAEQNVLCSFGELTCTPAPDISRAEQHRLVDTLLLPWLDYHLKGSCNASAVFQDILTSSEDWTFNQSCDPCFPLSTTQAEQDPLFRLFPLPSSGNFYLEAEVEFAEIDLLIFNDHGSRVFQRTIKNEKKGLWQINAGLVPGVYYVQASHDSRVETLKLIVQQ